MEGGIFDGGIRLVPTEFEAPRELEHPLLGIEQASASTLVWIQPQLMRPAYELWADERVLATLRFRGLLHDQALAASADGLWKLERAGVTGQEIKAYQCSRPYATLTPKDDSISALTLADGRAYIWTADNSGKQWFFLNILGKPLLQFIPECSHQAARIRVQLGPDAVRTPVLTFLALLGKYVLLGRRTGRSDEQ